jgi:hypothetical protein
MYRRVTRSFSERQLMKHDISAHKVHIYLEYHSVCPLVRIGTPPTPSPLASVSLPSEPKGGTHWSGGEGVRGPNSDDSVYSALYSLVKAGVVQCSPTPLPSKSFSHGAESVSFCDRGSSSPPPFPSINWLPLCSVIKVNLLSLLKVEAVLVFTHPTPPPPLLYPTTV